MPYSVRETSGAYEHPQVRPPRSIRSQAKKVRRAKVLDDCHIERVIKHIRQTSNSPASDELKVLFSYYAGLRACEIAALTLDCVTDANGRIGGHILVSRHAAKGRRERIVPMHPKIRDALLRFREAHPDQRILSFSARRGHIRPQNASAVKTWFLKVYKEVGLEGCSSHSGRRTFITRIARLANLHGSSLRDVQLLAGHACMSTTAAYIDPSDELVRLVSALGTSPSPIPTNLNSKGEQA